MRDDALNPVPHLMMATPFTDAASDAPMRDVQYNTEEPRTGQVTDANHTPTMARTNSDTQPPYVPQFSAATALILDRIKGGSQAFNSALSDASAAIPPPSKAAYEDARTRLVQSMNTTLDVSSPKPPGPSEPTSIGIKREREPDEQEPVDFTQNTMVMPPPRVIPRRAPVSGRDQSLDRQEKIEKMRQARIASLPEGVVPAKPELVGFPAGAASDYAVSSTRAHSTLTRYLTDTPL